MRVIVMQWDDGAEPTVVGIPAPWSYAEAERLRDQLELETIGSRCELIETRNVGTIMRLYDVDPRAVCEHEHSWRHTFAARWCARCGVSGGSSGCS